MKNISTEFEPPLCLKFYTKYEIENFGNFCSIFADFTWKSELDFSCEDKALFDEVFGENRCAVVIYSGRGAWSAPVVVHDIIRLQRVICHIYGSSLSGCFRAWS